MHLRASNTQRIFLRQWGVPAFRSRPALARSGRRHCTRSPKVMRDSEPRLSDSDTAEYMTRMRIQVPIIQAILREEDILVMFQCRARRPGMRARNHSGLA